MTPALYLPPAAGGFVGAMALSTLAYPGWAALLFGMGLASWALLEVRVLNRLFEGPMPEALRPTIGVELAPPAVATLAAGTIWPMLPGEVLIVGLGVAAGPIVAVMARYKWWHNVPFSIGFGRSRSRSRHWPGRWSRWCAAADGRRWWAASHSPSPRR